MVATAYTPQQPISMEIAATSREMIKPSSPTPHHLKHLKLSLIDQSLPFTGYISLIFFYSAQGDVHRFQNTNMSHRFKKSLSEVLTDFYPLAGKFISADHSIECCDDGLEYTEALVKAPLTLGQLLACPNPEELDLLKPHDVYNYGTGFRGLSAVQVSVFEECGGMAIGFSLSHLIGDAASLGVFINTWAAAVARGGEDIDKDKTVAAVFDTTSIFPPRDMPAQKCDELEDFRKNTVKRFVFPQLKIEALKAKFRYHRPSRVEVVSSLLFKCLINVYRSRCAKPILTAIPINLRSRMKLPLPTHYFGNMALTLLMEPVGPECQPKSLNDMGMELRRLIKEIDSDYVEKLQANNASLLFEYLERPAKFEGQFIVVTSWCGFHVYEADVGWGVPTWVASVHPTWEECVVLMDAKNGDGIEAWVNLGKEDMALFESDDELLEFACPNPIVSEF